jgi:hypothetical protein
MCDIRGHTSPERIDIPGRSFRRLHREGGRDRIEGHSPHAMRHEEAKKSAEMSFKGGVSRRAREDESIHQGIL